MSNPLAFIIEDDDDARAIFTAALTAAGFAVRPIVDGQEAQQALQTAAPQLIILDLHLPHVAGNELLHQIRNDNRLVDVPVILATADRLTATQLEQEANIVLLKPISFNQLTILAKRLYARYQ